MANNNNKKLFSWPTANEREQREGQASGEKDRRNGRERGGRGEKKERKRRNGEKLRYFPRRNIFLNYHTDAYMGYANKLVPHIFTRSSFQSIQLKLLVKSKQRSKETFMATDNVNLPCGYNFAVCSLG